MLSSDEADQGWVAFETSGVEGDTQRPDGARFGDCSALARLSVILHKKTLIMLNRSTKTEIFVHDTSRSGGSTNPSLP